MKDTPTITQTIVLVDDDRNILTSLSFALETEGYRVESYTDGASALKGLTLHPPHLAIFDIKMPRMDGMELLRRLRQKSDIPVIFSLLKMMKLMNCLVLKWEQMILLQNLSPNVFSLSVSKLFCAVPMRAINLLQQELLPRLLSSAEIW